MTISFLFLVPTLCPNLTPSFFGSNFSRSEMLKTKLSVNPEGCNPFASLGPPYPTLTKPGRPLLFCFLWW